MAEEGNWRDMIEMGHIQNFRTRFLWTGKRYRRELNCAELHLF